MANGLKKKFGTMDMTKKSPLGLLLLFSLPMLVGNVFQQLYNLADMIIVGRVLGKDALAAVGATGSVTFLFFALCNGIGSGGGVITSQFFGQGDEVKVKKCIANTGYIMIVFPTLIGILAFALARPILTFLKTDPLVLEESINYMRIICLGIVFVSLYNYASSMLRALGDSLTPFIFLFISCIINIGLDIYFVYYLKLGVSGAAYATVIAQILSGLGCLIFALCSNYYFKFKKEELKVDKKIIVSVVKLGIPMSLQFALIAISCMALQRVVNSFGPIAMAVFAATGRIEQLVHQPYQTLGAALSTYTGQNYGAGEHKRIFDGYKIALVIMLIFSLIMLPVMQFCGESIMSWFVTEEDGIEVIVMGAKALRISSLFYVFLGTIYVIRGVLNGLGDAVFALINGFVEVLGRFTVPILLTGISTIGVWGIWWSVGIVWFVSGLTAYLRYAYFSKRLKVKPSEYETISKTEP